MGLLTVIACVGTTELRIVPIGPRSACTWNHGLTRGLHLNDFLFVNLEISKSYLPTSCPWYTGLSWHWLCSEWSKQKGHNPDEFDRRQTVISLQCMLGLWVWKMGHSCWKENVLSWASGHPEMKARTFLISPGNAEFGNVLIFIISSILT